MISEENEKTQDNEVSFTAVLVVRYWRVGYSRRIRTGIRAINWMTHSVQSSMSSDSWTEGQSGIRSKRTRHRE